MRICSYISHARILHRVKKNSKAFFPFHLFIISSCFDSKKIIGCRNVFETCLQIQFTTGFSTTDGHLSELMAHKSTYIGRYYYTLYVYVY